MSRMVAIGAVIGFAITVLLLAIFGRESSAPAPAPTEAPAAAMPGPNRVQKLAKPEIRAPLNVGRPILIPAGVGATGPAPAPVVAEDAGS